ncbi:hypothetical protein [Nocardioides sp.]|uniref:hypothetical protein n=1 Tax=Nocardioides sp. TaxID=35761 RepID=UPI0031FF0C14|nr:hypothetical protein [Nocardioides sp.]
MVVHEVRRGPGLRRLAVVLAAVATVLAGIQLSDAVSPAFPASVPRAHCGPGSHPETSSQGRVPARDYQNGRAAKGYTCNTRQVAHQGKSGGFKVLRYTDRHGRTCAFYDSTLLFPRDLLGNLKNLTKGLGVIVLDMTRPDHPRQTANLTSLAMISPHESLLVNKKRGLLAGVLGTAATYPGILDVYDVKSDCRHPRLLSSTPSGLLGHESGWSSDGKTFYSSSAALTLVAVDLTNPRVPVPLFTQFGVSYHGLRLSADNKTMYVANLGKPGPTLLTGGGLRILDVSEIQERKTNPSVKVLSTITWREHSIPQVAQPFTRNGKHYVLEVDEFVDLFELSGLTDLAHAPVGAARIINVDDPRHPRIVSDIRLQVHQPGVRTGPQYRDPGASFPAQGYAAHYCSMPTAVNPKIAGCSMILSGLRLFDIRDVRHPKEIGYFNKPTMPGTKLGFPVVEGAYAMSQPAWDVKRHSVWYTDANSGFYVVRLTNGVGKLLTH